MAKYISDAIVNGFTMGAAMVVIISQIPSLLGIPVKFITEINPEYFYFSF